MKANVVTSVIHRDNNAYSTTLCSLLYTRQIITNFITILLTKNAEKSFLELRNLRSTTQPPLFLNKTSVKPFILRAKPKCKLLELIFSKITSSRYEETSLKSKIDLIKLN